MGKWGAGVRAEGRGKSQNTSCLLPVDILKRGRLVRVFFFSFFTLRFFFLKHTYTALDTPWFIVSVRFDGARMLFNVNHCRLVIHDWRHLKCWKLRVTGSVAWVGEEETSARKTPPSTCTTGSQTPSFYSVFSSRPFFPFFIHPSSMTLTRTPKYSVGLPHINPKPFTNKKWFCHT